MKKTKLILTILVLLLSVSFASASHATKSTLDLTIAGVSARAMGMGRAYVGVLEGSEAVFLNPAGIATSQSWGLTSMSTKLLDRVDYKMLGGVYPTEYGVFGVGYIGTSTPAGFLTTDKASLGSAKQISYGSNLLVISYGKKIKDGGMKDTAFGVNLKMFSNNFEGVDASGAGMDMDIAVQIKPRKELKIGAILQNFLPEDMGGSVTWKSNTKESVPSVFKFGGSYQALPNLLVAADLDLAASGNQPMTLHGGVEWKPISMVAIRAGLDQNPASKDSTVTDLSFGVGINLKGFSFDYAYKNNSLVENSNAHYVSISFDARQFNAKETAPLVEKAQKSKAGKVKFASRQERNEYLYKVATGKIK